MAFLRFLPTVVIYVPVHLVFGRPVGPQLLWVVPLTALMVVMASGFAMIVAAVQVYFRDLANFVPYVLRVGMFLSPVLYLPADVPGGYKLLLDINPLGQLLTAWSQVLYSGHAPGWHSLAIAAAWAVGAFFVGALFFMSREREFAVRI
jgi:ABC-type polysaccharide/polyol phosphate export permease